MRILLSLLFQFYCICVVAQPFLPVAVTGFNEDIVAEEGNSALNTTTREMDAVGISNFVLCSKSFAASNNFIPGNIYGLPDNGILETGDRRYQLGDFQGSNALYLFSGDSGTLNLNTPSRFTDFSLLGLATEGNAQLRIVFHFSDGSIQEANRQLLDWFSASLPATFSGYGRVKRKNGPFIQGTDYEAAPAGNPKFGWLDFTLPCTKTLTRIGFRNTSAPTGSSFRAFILAASGKEKNVVPQVSIAASSLDVCQGSRILFKASGQHTGAAPFFIWRVNDAVAAIGVDSFATMTLQQGDIVRCTMESNETCAFPLSVVSNSLSASIRPNFDPKITITGGEGAQCAGTIFSFSANTFASGSAWVSWQKNGLSLADTGLALSLSNLQNGDTITAKLWSKERCRTRDSVMSNKKEVRIIPVYEPVLSGPDTVMIDQGAVQLTFSPPGGTFSGPALDSNSFFPERAGIGPHRIRYYFPGNICSDTADLVVYVKELKLPCQTLPMTLITADGNGKNDQWIIGDFNKTCIQKAHVQIFNRWGKLIFEDENYLNQWSAADTGEGCYFFYIRASLFGTSTPIQSKGTLWVLK